MSSGTAGPIARAASALLIAAMLCAGLVTGCASSSEQGNDRHLAGAWNLQTYSGRGCAPAPPKRLDFLPDGSYESRQDGSEITQRGTYEALEQGRVRLAVGREGTLNYIVKIDVADGRMTVTTQDCEAGYEAMAE